MPPKAVKEKAVKGDEAEDIVLQYMKSVNRPYASTDVSANLKNKVTKANAQKVLQSLADKGSLTMKMYGKQSIFVYNQEYLETMPAGAIAALEAELKFVKEDLEGSRKSLKALTNEISIRIAEPKTEEIEGEIEQVEAQNAIALKHLIPLRNASDGKTPGENGEWPIGKEQLDALNAEWSKWRKEWISRRKVYQALLDVVQPDLAGASRLSFEEEIGVDQDPDELKALEASDLCKPQSAVRFGGVKSATIQGSKPNAFNGQTDSAISTPRVATKRKRE
ncbi:hypothetical protein NliqN6_5558 [Naganishia liquefaciens]|uniref:Homologous-pairing protein 2 winged helix domain-containing protein n=1 Tax=Naganishia liquefaciens TaxID=104408 RepID=A0A8H3YJ38_9TREE|nr:hypothetical protein NliqN6_5558 [Naganishia liquefaciens]